MSTDTAIAAQATRERSLRWERVARIVRHAILFTWTGFIALPIFWMVSTSFKDAASGWLGLRTGFRISRRCTTTRRYSLSARSTLRSAARQPNKPSHLQGPRRCHTGVGTFLAYAISRFGMGGKHFRHTIPDDPHNSADRGSDLDPDLLCDHHPLCHGYALPRACHISLFDTWW